MTKQEAIQEAYGEYWETVKNYVSENGWIDYSKINIEIFRQLDCDCYSSFCSDTVRPKSLEGLENNNGWTKIESVDDFPKESGIYLIAKYGVIADECAVFDSETQKWWIDVVRQFPTHYKEFPEPPIY